MAKDIQTIERSVATPTSNVSAGNSFERLGSASGALATIITDKLNEAQIGMEAKQGELDALSGEAPKTLAPGFNKVTRAYNAAVSDTEARQQVLSAKEQISQQVMDMADSVDVDLPGKTKSQRVRAVLYRIWELEKDGHKTFESYYAFHMEKHISSLKEHLEQLQS